MKCRKLPPAILWQAEGSAPRGSEGAVEPSHGSANVQKYMLQQPLTFTFTFMDCEA